MDPVKQIATAVLYEGYVLWPYRRTSIKNQKRWTFGGVYPRAYSELRAGSDPWLVQTECLVVGSEPILEITVRFLHVVERRVARKDSQGALEFVDELRVGSARYYTWEEAREREVALVDLKLPELGSARTINISLPEGREEEPLSAPDGEVVGALVRSWWSLEGTVEVGAMPIEGALYKVTVRIRNLTPWSGEDRESTLRRTLVSTHAVLRVEDGEFVSLTDPPQELKRVAEECENVKLWPVLVGEDGDRHTMLASPIILYDYPRIAPESPGDLFDGTEIDQLLIMNILTLTDEEKAEMRATDPRTKEILERSESFTKEDFMRLHGAIRELRVVRPEEELPMYFEHMETPGPETVVVGGVAIQRGSKVRLQPRPGGDIMDIALAGQVAFVEAIEQDYEGGIHLAVTLENDPGRDLGQERQIGHRFFFSPDEIEPMGGVVPGEP